MVLFLLGKLSVVVGDIHFLLRLRLRVSLPIHLRQELTDDVLPRFVEGTGLGCASLSCQSFFNPDSATQDILKARSADVGLYRLGKDCWAHQFTLGLLGVLRTSEGMNHA